jgi:hypothetical protein
MEDGGRRKDIEARRPRRQDEYVRSNVQDVEMGV